MTKVGFIIIYSFTPNCFDQRKHTTECIRGTKTTLVIVILFDLWFNVPVNNYGHVWMKKINVSYVNSNTQNSVDTEVEKYSDRAYREAYEKYECTKAKNKDSLMNRARKDWRKSNLVFVISGIITNNL